MNPIQINEINRILNLARSARLTHHEIDVLTHANSDPNTLEDYYNLCRDILVTRSKYQANIERQLEALQGIAAADGVTIEYTAQIPDINIPYFCGGIVETL